jgi:mRNA interferase MazF
MQSGSRWREVILLNIDSQAIVDPHRSEVWQVNLGETVGAEMRKVHPAVVVSSSGIRTLPIRLIAPITTWKDHFSESRWLVKIDPDPHNGLTHPSAVDALQLRGLSLERFIEKRGRLSAGTMEDIVTAIATVVEYV